MVLFASRSRSTLLVCLILSGLAPTGCRVVALRKGEAAAPQTFEPRGKRRVVMYYDPQGLWYPALGQGDPKAAKWLKDPENWKKALETLVFAELF